MQSEVCLWGIRQSAIICNAMHALMFRQLVYDASDILVRISNPLVLPRASESENLTTVSMITGLDWWCMMLVMMRYWCWQSTQQAGMMLCCRKTIKLQALCLWDKHKWIPNDASIAFQSPHGTLMVFWMVQIKIFILIHSCFKIQEPHQRAVMKHHRRWQRRKTGGNIEDQLGYWDTDQYFQDLTWWWSIRSLDFPWTTENQRWKRVLYVVLWFLFYQH